MKTIRFLAALVLGLALCAGAAADIQYTLTESAPGTQISVSGTGEVYVPADTVTISLGVSYQAADVTGAQQEVNTRIAAVRQAILAQGIPEEDVSTGTISVYSVSSYAENREKIIGYNASSTLTIRSKQLDTAGSLIDAALAAGANILNDLSFSASDTTAAEEQALRLAVADARRQAEVLADASGLTLDRLMSLNAGSVYNYGSANTYAARSVSMEDASAGTYVQAAKICVSASVNAVYEAK